MRALDRSRNRRFSQVEGLWLVGACLSVVLGCGETSNHGSATGGSSATGGTAGNAGSAAGGLGGNAHGGAAQGGAAQGGASGAGGVGTDATRHLLVVVFEPRNPSNGKLLWEDYAYNDPASLTQQALAWWDRVSAGKLHYEVVETQHLEEIPVKSDGFTYDYSSWSAVIQDPTTSHQPDISDYEAIIAETDLCTKVNAGLVDELWMFGAPYFGFAESALAGPGTFGYNGPGFSQNACAKLVPIMGFNYERGLPELLHDFGHRAEATMAQVFRSWQENQMSHDWDRFALVAAQSPSFGVSGCGSIHYPPNAAADYEYSSTTPALSYCDAFLTYPNLPSDLVGAAVPIECSAWGCTQEGYLEWWFTHFPSAAGSKDGIGNDWWRYFIDPNLARDCSYQTSQTACTTDARCQWACGGCFRSTVDATAACSPCGMELTLDGCNAHGGCAWYSCGSDLLNCWPTGTDPSVACSG